MLIKYIIPILIFVVCCCDSTQEPLKIKKIDYNYICGDTVLYTATYSGIWAEIVRFKSSYGTFCVGDTIQIIKYIQDTSKTKKDTTKNKSTKNNKEKKPTLGQGLKKFWKSFTS